MSVPCTPPIPASPSTPRSRASAGSTAALDAVYMTVSNALDDGNTLTSILQAVVDAARDHSGPLRLSPDEQHALSRQILLRAARLVAADPPAPPAMGKGQGHAAAAAKGAMRSEPGDGRLGPGIG
jgi:hypothetical protein